MVVRGGLSVVAAGAVVALAAGCAGRADSGARPGGVSASSRPVLGAQHPGSLVRPAPDTTPRMPAPPGGRAAPADRVDARALPRDVPHQAFVVGDGRTVVVRGMAGGCERASAAVTGQDARAVHVTVTSVRLPGHTMCTRELRYPALPVHLAAPLGDRTVVLDSKKVSG